MDNTKPLIGKTETVIKIADDKTEQETDALDAKIKVLSPKSIAERKTDTALNAANSFRSETVRKNWKTVLDVAMTNRSFPEAGGRSVDGGPNFHHNNDIFVSDKFNWIFFAIIMTLLIILSIIFCSLVYFFLPQFRIKEPF
jgi:hypothetical protein